MCYRAFLVHNQDRAGDVVRGYVRRCDAVALPVDLLAVITSFYTEVFLHLMAIGHGLHWRILLDELLET